LFDSPDAAIWAAGPIDDNFRLALHGYMLNFTNFSGITQGTVIFDEFGDRINPYSLLNYGKSGAKRQVTGITPVIRAEWDPVGDNWVTFTEVVWPDGTTNVPLDHIPLTVQYVEEAILIVFIVLACLAFLVPVVNLVFLIRYRKHERVTASTPIFLVFILFGSMLALAVIWVISVDPTDATCVIPWWFAHLAFWIIFSCLFAKTARILYIFTMTAKVTARSIRPITNLELGAFVAFCCFSVLTYLAIWTGIDPPYPQLVPDPNNPYQILVLSCYVQNPWIIPLYGVEFAFLLVGSFLAYKINQIDILRAEMIRFNESAHIAVSIYCIIFVGLVLVPIIHWLDVQSNDTKYVLSCIGILVCILTLNIVLFWPKWRDIITNKADDPYSSRTARTGPNSSAKPVSVVTVGNKTSSVNQTTNDTSSKD